MYCFLLIDQVSSQHSPFSSPNVSSAQPVTILSQIFGTTANDADRLARLQLERMQEKIQAMTAEAHNKNLQSNRIKLLLCHQCMHATIAGLLQGEDGSGDAWVLRPGGRIPGETELRKV